MPIVNLIQYWLNGVSRYQKQCISGKYSYFVRQYIDILRMSNIT